MSRSITRVHLQYDLTGVAQWNDRDLDGMLVEIATGRRLSAPEVRAALGELQANGFRALAPDCPAPNDDGTCPGHRLEAK